MIRKISNNKGISLVEILVSLAIVGIMIFPIFSMVNTAIKTNKRSELRQQATLLGQEIIEELEFKEEIDSNKITLSGGQLTGNVKNEDSVTIFEYESNNYKKAKNEYYVKISFQENSNVKYNYDTSNNDNINTELEIKDKFKLESDSVNSGIKIKKDSSGESEFTIPVDYNNKQFDLSILNNGEGNKININSKGSQIVEYSISENKFILNFTKEYLLDDGITINVFNNLTTPVDIYIQKSYDCNEKIYIQRSFGDIKINNISEPEDIKNSKMNNLYDISIEIMDKNKEKELFQGNINKNIKIKVKN